MLLEMRSGCSDACSSSRKGSTSDGAGMEMNNLIINSPLLGSRVSLLAQDNFTYEGVLISINTDDNSIVLEQGGNGMVGQRVFASAQIKGLHVHSPEQRIEAHTAAPALQLPPSLVPLESSSQLEEEEQALGDEAEHPAVTAALDFLDSPGVAHPHLDSPTAAPAGQGSLEPHHWAALPTATALPDGGGDDAGGGGGAADRGASLSPLLSSTKDACWAPAGPEPAGEGGAASLEALLSPLLPGAGAGAGAGAAAGAARGLFSLEAGPFSYPRAGGDGADARETWREAGPLSPWPPGDPRGPRPLRREGGGGGAPSGGGEGEGRRQQQQQQQQAPFAAAAGGRPSPAWEPPGQASQLPAEAFPAWGPAGPALAPPQRAGAGGHRSVASTPGLRYAHAPASPPLPGFRLAPPGEGGGGGGGRGSAPGSGVLGPVVAGGPGPPHLPMGEGAGGGGGGGGGNPAKVRSAVLGPRHQRAAAEAAALRHHLGARGGPAAGGGDGGGGGGGAGGEYPSPGGRGGGGGGGGADPAEKRLRAVSLGNVGDYHHTARAAALWSGPGGGGPQGPAGFGPSLGGPGPGAGGQGGAGGGGGEGWAPGLGPGPGLGPPLPREGYEYEYDPSYRPRGGRGRGYGGPGPGGGRGGGRFYDGPGRGGGGGGGGGWGALPRHQRGGGGGGRGGRGRGPREAPEWGGREEWGPGGGGGGLPPYPPPGPGGPGGWHPEMEAYGPGSGMAPGPGGLPPPLEYGYEYEGGYDPSWDEWQHGGGRGGGGGGGAVAGRWGAPPYTPSGHPGRGRSQLGGGPPRMHWHPPGAAGGGGGPGYPPLPPQAPPQHPGQAAPPPPPGPGADGGGEGRSQSYGEDAAGNLQLFSDGNNLGGNNYSNYDDFNDATMNISNLVESMTLSNTQQYHQPASGAMIHINGGDAPPLISTFGSAAASLEANQYSPYNHQNNDMPAAPIMMPPQMHVSLDQPYLAGGGDYSSLMMPQQQQQW